MMVDQFFCRNPEVMGTFDPRGANPTLLFALREALDKEGFQHVKIIATGGFNADRIRKYEEAGVPIDIYGVGGSLLKINIGFTGDNVRIGGEHEAKSGRRFRDNPRLTLVD
ncbi:nicotinate phosphoribosyltransferase [Halalkalibacter hemicellulosilyticusJCM 9152]|uniref:Nicotinate phosphoribosyltransferase n=1 Tax=Halalkalibacter hemicellulosilyticusJCM 9152 TaxID=1236971 RepID=W4QM19_9BACI|nr:nicotinate phosphoribosyltransferase [Halalkalibacter hemicellulosilyticusJCM 9152]